MVNVIDMSENPTFPDGTSVRRFSQMMLMNEYMEHMYGELLKRASHPVFFSSAVSDAMDVVGIKNARSLGESSINEIPKQTIIFRNSS